MGFRISSNFVWSDGHVLEEYVDGSLDRNYVHGNQYIDELILFEDSSGDYHYYLQDFRYAVYALVDDTGTIEERYRFDPYGKRTVVTNDANIDEHYGFTGRYHDDSDDTDLVYFRERWLSPEMGRFISRDPVEYWNGMSLYSAYFAVNYIDPFGQRTFYMPYECTIMLLWADESDFVGTLTPKHKKAGRAYNIDEGDLDIRVAKSSKMAFICCSRFYLNKWIKSENRVKDPDRSTWKGSISGRRLKYQNEAQRKQGIEDKKEELARLVGGYIKQAKKEAKEELCKCCDEVEIVLRVLNVKRINDKFKGKLGKDGIRRDGIKTLGISLGEKEITGPGRYSEKVECP